MHLWERKFSNQFLFCNVKNRNIRSNFSCQNLKFKPEEIIPAKSFNMQTQHIGETSYPKSLRGFLLALTSAAII